MWWSSNLIMPYIKTTVVIFMISFDVLFVRTIHASRLIHWLLTFPRSLELSIESGLSNVIHPSCSLDFDQMVLLGLNWLRTMEQKFDLIPCTEF